MIKIGLIGCGYWGRNYFRNFEHLDNVLMDGCCDPAHENLEHAKNVLKNIRLFQETDDLLSDDQINAIVIATPADTHYELAKKSLLSGKHTLVEKPLAMKAAEAEELIKIADSKGLVLMVGHIMEFNPAIVKLKEIIDQKKLGDLTYLYLTRTNLGKIRFDVNVIWDLAPHDLSIVHYLLGRTPKRVSLNARSFIQKDIEDIGFIMLDYDDGLVVSIHVSWLDPCKIRRVTVVGDKKMAVLDDLETMDKIRIYDRGITYSASADREFEDFGSYQFSYRYGDILIPQLDLKEPLKEQCTHFIECIRDNKRPRTDGVNGLNVVKVLEAAHRSKDIDGKFVDID